MSPNSRKSRSVKRPASSHLQGRDLNMSEPAVLVTPTCFVGIDVSKDNLDVVVLPGGELRTFSNDRAGWAKLVAWLQELPPSISVLEATGGYERGTLFALQDGGLHVAMVNPRQVRDFAKATRQFAKTDALDAQVLAEFARLLQPTPSEKTSEKLRELDEFVTRRRQLIETRVAEHNRAEHATTRLVWKTTKRLTEVLDKEIKAVEKAIAKLLEDDAEWKGKVQIVASVPGVGGATSMSFIADLPELGKLNRQQISSLVGQGKRSIQGGRRRLRSVLYMAALSARRCNPVIKKFAERLAQAGKAFKVIQVACMRKLLVILNTMVKNNTLWNATTA
jgi:transposase